MSLLRYALMNDLTASSSSARREGEEEERWGEEGKVEGVKGRGGLFRCSLLLLSRLGVVAPLPPDRRPAAE